ncbi:type II toxin-antitoxin system VapC family toxin [Brucella sp. IR073]|uniref:type II toxin-antitoxin system VapC family toxin n=1 Tax=unclassified Brucella TaxID=2632610 RepID=UPI003B98500B
MNGYLLDTNIISSLFPSTARSSIALAEWLEGIEANGGFFLSAVTIHEIEKGICLLERKGASTKAGNLRIWLSGLLATYDDRIIAVDKQVCSISGMLEAASIAAGHNPGLADALIAGSAKVHQLVVVTKNRRHFQSFGIELLTPAP